LALLSPLLRTTKRLLAFSLAGALSYLGSVNLVYAEPLLVSVVQSEDSGAYAEFTATLRESLLNTNVVLTVVNSGQPLPQKTNLIVAVGMKAASEVGGSNALAVLNVMIPRSGHRKLLQDFPKRESSHHFSSIYIDQPIDRQLRLIAAAFPDRNNLGVLYAAPIPDEIGELKLKSAEYGFSLYADEINPNVSLFQEIQELLKHSDVFLSLPSPTIFNSSTLRNILVSTYQAGVPMVGFSSSLVKAGAMCGVFTSPAQIANQASAVILNFGTTGTLPAAQYPKFYDVVVNERVAQSMNITIQSADELKAKMDSLRRRAP
jgi:hypothetical protein